MVERVGIFVHRLHPGRVVHMRHRGDLRAFDVEFVDAEELVFRFRHLAPEFGLNIGDQKHIRAVVVELEPLGHVFAQNRRREGAEALAKLDPQI